MKQLLVFVLLVTMLCWFMFAPVYKHVIIVRQAVLQKEVDYLLEIGANGRHGYIDQSMIQESRNRMEARGFTPGELVYMIGTTTGTGGTDATSPVWRGAGLSLKLTYPYHRLFVIDRLVGITVPAETDRMGASGMKMSEYVP
ncbi:hypothetical protein P5G65_12195 [Paenibacillus chondroitinus]|uniref:DUF4359 domain-containing protein n=1 Tax=Paenibacillus chondroitinus TaxID=59842 RepID=A0ABU6DB91_9BACL|nr:MULTISPECIES: hypothetical protein [Paenibacillus]MCY9662302.1 hypothetical protein [Paenibacillus anseongense]MEB4794660.1 hypothetical protein [Paenibacillus chondroitinus]